MKAIKIVVCIKQIPDPEAPLGSIKVDRETKSIDCSSLRTVINPYDENAMEAALQLREENAGEVTVLSLGDRLDASVLRKALAVGADDLVLIEDSRFQDMDTNSTAYALSMAIKKLGQYDVVLTGRQAGDWDSGHTGIILGELLGVPTINLARSVKIQDGKLIVHKIFPGGYQVVRAPLPAVVTVSNEVGELRYPTMKQILVSRRKPIRKLDAQDLGVDWDRVSKMGVKEVVPPPDLGRGCEFVDGASPEEKGENLAIILKRRFG